MKYLKLFENYNKEIGNTYKEDGWMIMELDYENYHMILDRFYKDKELIGSDGDFDVYYLDNTEKDEDGDDFWHSKMVIYIDPRKYTIKTKKLLDEPIYKVRNSKLTMEQELTLRTWVGTDKRPKSGKFMGKFLGVDEDGIASIISPYSGNVLTIKKDGEVIT